MKGQSAIEFTMMVAMGMIVLIILLVMGVGASSGKIDEQRNKALLHFGYSLQEEIILATTVRPGYERDIILPDTIGKFRYEITNTATAFTLTSGLQQYVFRTPALTGTLQKGENTIVYDGSVRII